MRFSIWHSVLRYALILGLALALPAAFEAAAQQGGISVDTGRLLQVRTLLVMARTHEQDRQLAMADTAYREAVEIAEQLEPLDVPLALLWRASFLRRNGRMPEARVAAERALDLLLATLGPHHPTTAVAYGALGSMEHQARDYTKAGPHLQAVIDAYARDPDKGREPEVWVAAWNLALELKEGLQLGETERLLRLALELKSRLLPYEPWWIARIYQELAMNRGSQGEIDDAAAFYERAASAAESVVGENNALLVSIFSAQAVSLQRWGRSEASFVAAKRALAAHQRAAPPDWISITNLTFMLANGALAKGDRVEADERFTYILQEFDRDPSRIKASLAAMAAHRLTESLRDARRYVEAEAMARRALELRLRDDPVNQRDVARAHQTLGFIQFARNKVSAGAAELRRGIDILARVDGVPLTELASMYQWLGDSYFEAGFYRESEEPILSAIDLLSKQGDAMELSVAQLRLSITYRYLERFAESEKLAREVLAVRKDKLKLAEDDTRLADALFQLAAVLRWQRKYAEAEPLLRQSLRIREKAYGQDHRLVLADMNALALSLDGLERSMEAEPLFRRTLAGRERVLGAEHEEVADTLVSLVWSLRRQGRYAEAAEIAERPLAIYRTALGADHPTVVRALLPLATIRQERGEFEEAGRLFREALRLRVRTYGFSSLRVADSYGDLVRLSLARRQYEEATGYMGLYLTIYEGVLGAEDWRLIDPLMALASLHLFTGDLEAAEATAKRMLGLVEKEFAADSIMLANTSLYLAYVFRLQGRFGNVERYYERPLAIYRQKLGPRHPYVAYVLRLMAEFRTALGQSEEAVALYDESLSIAIEAYGEDRPAISTTLNDKAQMLLQMGQTEEAVRLMERAIALLRKGAGKPTPNLAIVLVNLSFAYEALGRRADAEKLRSEATAIYSELYGPDRLPPIVPLPLLPPPPKEI